MDQFVPFFPLQIIFIKSLLGAHYNNHHKNAIVGIDKLAMLMGHEHASKYFARVFDNLKIKEL